MGQAEPDRSLTIGPTRYGKGGWVKFGRYASGEIGMTVYNVDTGEPEMKPSVSLAQFGATPFGVWCLWLKTWGENEGIEAAILRAEIGTMTGRTWHLNEEHEGSEILLSPKAIAVFKQQTGEP